MSSSAPGSEGSAEEPISDVVTMVLLADPAALSVVRERLRRWLTVLVWPASEVDDVVLAVNEAVSNSVEHMAPAGLDAEVRVAGRLMREPDGGRRVVIGVSDNRSPTAAGFHGYGLLMIHACMDSVELARDAGGTTLVMTSVRVPPAAGER